MLFLTAAMLLNVACTADNRTEQGAARITNEPTGGLPETETPETKTTETPEALTEAPVSEMPVIDGGREFRLGFVWVVIKEEYHDHIFTRADFPEIDSYNMLNDLSPIYPEDWLQSGAYTRDRCGRKGTIAEHQRIKK